MSVPNLTNSLIQPQNIVLNQVPIQHTIMSNVNNGIPMSTSLPSHPHQSLDQNNEIKQEMVHETTSAAVPIQQQQIVQQAQPIQQQIQQPQQQTQVITQKPIQTTNSSLSLISSDNQQQAQILTKQRLQDLVRDTDSTLNLEEEVEEIILSYVDEFVDRCLNGAAMIAKNRQVKSIEVKDVQQFLSRNYNMWTPGFGTDELKPYKRSMTTDAHKQRMALIRKTLKKY